MRYVGRRRDWQTASPQRDDGDEREARKDEQGADRGEEARGDDQKAIEDGMLGSFPDTAIIQVMAYTMRRCQARFNNVCGKTRARL